MCGLLAVVRVRAVRCSSPAGLTAAADTRYSADGSRVILRQMRRRYRQPEVQVDGRRTRTWLNQAVLVQRQRYRQLDELPVRQRQIIIDATGCVVGSLTDRPVCLSVALLSLAAASRLACRQTRLAVRASQTR